jgi:NADH-quinone oxidoreductase subunit L
MNVAIISSVVAVLGLGLSFMIYGNRPSRDPLESKLSSIYPVLKEKYYFDALYGWYVDQVQQKFAKLLFWLEQTLLVRVGVHGLTSAVKATGHALRQLQTGLVQFYALVFVLGTVLLFLIMVTRL